MTQEERQAIGCRDAHRVENTIPSLNNVEFDGQTCNCGRLEFFTEMCACPHNPHLELKSRSNPNYNYQNQ